MGQDAHQDGRNPARDPAGQGLAAGPAALLLLLLLGLDPVHAQPVPESPLARAKALVARADVQFRLNDPAGALEGYRAAYRLVQLPTLLFSIAQCHRLLGQHDPALSSYKAYLHDYRQARGRYPANEPLVRRLLVRVEADKRIAATRVEDRERRARRRADAPRSPRSGRLRLVGLDPGVHRGGVQVFVDNMLQAEDPARAPIPVPAGKHRVVVKALGHLSWIKEVEITAGKEVVLDVPPLRRRPTRSRLWLASTLTSAALAAGAEAMAVVFTLEADAHFKDTPPFRQDRDLMVAGHCLAGAFAALAVTSLVLYLRSDRPAEQADVRAGVTLPRGGAALAGGIRF